MVYDRIQDLVGNTPMVKISSDAIPNIELFAKLEGYEPSGSVKDRAAAYIIKTALERGDMNKDTTIIESSSGNFGIALATHAKRYGMRFVCVIDPHINPINEKIIRNLGAEVIKVSQPDSAGGYLLERIRTVNEFVKNNPNTYWVNQYGNPLNAEAYFNTLGNEICDDIPDLDYIFMGVSSGGTISGTSPKIKERIPNAKVIAVDIVGSVIFGGKPQKRYIPGIGSSMVPSILKQAKIDEVVMLDEIETIDACNELLQKHCIFVGGSSGSVYAGVKKYFAGKTFDKKPKVVVMFADRGERYQETVYNDEWVEKFKANYHAHKQL